MTPIVRKFGDEERSFAIHPKNVPMFEAAMGRSLYAILRTFIDQNWKFDEVAKILSFALLGPSEGTIKQWDYALQAARYGLQAGPVSYAPHPSVLATLNADGHGNYADLAADILSAAIFREVTDDAA